MKMEEEIKRMSLAYWRRRTKQQSLEETVRIAYENGFNNCLSMPRIATPPPMISEWQLCPMCGGEGAIDNIGTSTSVKRQCPVCNGRAILIKPVINKNIPGL